MHPQVFQTYDELCRPWSLRGRILEVGATPDESSLLNLPALAGATEKVGVNLNPPATFRDYTIQQLNANDLAPYADGSFDAVLCNAVLEHDRYFWRTVAEIRRVTRPGGRIILGAPGYGESRAELKFQRRLARLARWLGRPEGWPRQHGTLTLRVHNYPGDYYRFSEQAFREVLLEGLTEIGVRSVLQPPRIIGWGIRP